MPPAGLPGCYIAHPMQRQCSWAAPILRPVSCYQVLSAAALCEKGTMYTGMEGQRLSEPRFSFFPPWKVLHHIRSVQFRTMLNKADLSIL